MADELSAEAARIQVENLEREAKRLREKHAIASTGEGGGADDLKGKAAQEDTDASLFDRLSASGELAKVAVEDPARFAQLVEAKRLAGERSLFGRSLP